MLAADNTLRQVQPPSPVRYGEAGGAAAASAAVIQREAKRCRFRVVPGTLTFILESYLCERGYNGPCRSGCRIAASVKTVFNP